jgi:uncharacterized RDD family membrane protein YckC
VSGSDDQPGPTATHNSAPTAELPNAGLMRRLAAVLYETLLLTAIGLVVGFLALPLVSPAVPGQDRSLTLPTFSGRLLVGSALVVAAGAYLIHGWTAGRRTLPQKTWRLRLVTAAGSHVDAKRALTRFLAAFVGPVLALGAYIWLSHAGLGIYAVWLIAFNFLWTLIDDERLFLHDRIAGTRLVVDRA